MPAEPRERGEAPARLAARRQPDEDHEDRHHGDGDREHDGRGQVARHDEAEDGNGDDQRQRHLRQPAREPRLERVDALDGRGHQLARTLAAQPRRPRAQHVRGERAAQLRHRARRAAAARWPRIPAAARPRASATQASATSVPRTSAGRAPSRKTRVTTRASERGLGDDERGRRAAERDGDRQVHAGRPARAQEPPVGALPGVRHRSGAESPRTASIGLRVGAKSSALRRWRNTQ